MLNKKTVIYSLHFVIGKIKKQWNSEMFECDTKYNCVMVQLYVLIDILIIYNERTNYMGINLFAEFTKHLSVIP